MDFNGSLIIKLNTYIVFPKALHFLRMNILHLRNIQKIHKITIHMALKTMIMAIVGISQVAFKVSYSRK